MKRYRIVHQTRYEFSDFVQLLSHALRVRPREGHELHLESFILDIAPTAALRWHRDAEGNSVAMASFVESTQSLTIKSEAVVQKHDCTPHDFLVADYAVDYPFSYSAEDKVLLAPYMGLPVAAKKGLLAGWMHSLWQPNEKLQTFALLLRVNQRIYQSLSYRRRDEEGVQTAEQTLFCGSGSCRDSASLFMTVAHQLGFASRFVSGYVYSNAAMAPLDQPGSTHAWAEVFIPGAGWKGFDPTVGNIAGAEHVAVAVARLPESVPPISGSFRGSASTSMTVDVRMTELNSL